VAVAVVVIDVVTVTLVCDVENVVVEMVRVSVIVTVLDAVVVDVSSLHSHTSLRYPCAPTPPKTYIRLPAQTAE